MNEDVVNEEGVMIQRAKRIYHCDNGNVGIVIPPDPYPTKEEQQRILDNLLSIMVNAKSA